MLGEDSHGKAEDMFNMMDKWVPLCYQLLSFYIIFHVVSLRDGDGTITEQEFIRACLEDVELSRLLSIRT